MMTLLGGGEGRGQCLILGNRSLETYSLGLYFVLITSCLPYFCSLDPTR